MQSAGTALSQPTSAIDKARSLLQYGEKLPDIRQKNTAADRSEHEWSTVTEYEEDELVENSDDEKRLFWAEARAGRKTKQKIQAAKAKKKRH